jgi:putative N6-adenine-specific DNA methylase
MQLVAKTLYGLEGVLADELRDLGARGVKIMTRAVEFEGDLELMYRCNYSLRTALSVLRPIADFRIKRTKDLYNVAKRLHWDDFFSIDQTFSVVPVVHSSLFNHTGYAALVLKDAIVDKFRMIHNRRPSVESNMPDILINLRVSEDFVTISLDSSAVPLYKRGYRKEAADAPINEVLAAGIIKLSGWDGSRRILDPMCGSGTFGIEAAMMSYRIEPGQFRSFYGFMNWGDFDEKLFEKIKNTKKKQLITAPEINCYDRSKEAIRIAANNIRAAGLSAKINTGIADFFASDSKGLKYTIFINPPYGERLTEKDLNEFYSKIGERLKHGYSGSEAWIISSSAEGMKSIGLKPAAKYQLFNGALESVLHKYVLFEGRHKDFKAVS